MQSMRHVLAAVAIVLVGLFGAATLGYAAYLVSRDSVGLPVTKLDTPENLAPAQTTPARPTPKTVPKPPPPPPAATTTVESGDDHGGRSGRGGGSGDDDGGGGGHGGDDD
jgi:uncharacterized membrane protein YgcG